nr:MAG TPA_asm: hypothetical protein [Caudoviricetes sp.]
MKQKDKCPEMVILSDLSGLSENGHFVLNVRF